ncbi:MULTISPECIES: outer membrane beta-barrel family protein [Flavobacteriaceae]|uniref:TonB-dependent receptor n=2 Tax=Flavobacteriaceae TaxID=49546 RepID=A0A4Y8AXB3_9FLAO|nr:MULTISPECIES: outer membrane beta-barrel family protein [Flavobacteriaceae]TEW76672.1 TonB-dependent receptor [Gramella jeungdoensis]GGK50985.1 TonB-dependent receptor [Lutibacter litoralis]
MRRILLLLIILTPLINYSQTLKKETYTVTGKIIDGTTKKALEDATIIFKDLDSNTIKYGGISNSRGKFSIEIEEGSYNITVEFISFKSKKINITKINRDLNIGIIALEVDIEFLEAIEIIGEKRAIDLKPNKLIYNVEKDIAAASGVATDALNNIPSVSISPNGNITVQGQGNVHVLINGKSSSLSSANALKSLPAGAIENIEVITNPGAKYSSSALSVINIILKKGKDEGLNASLTATAGFKDYSGGLFTINNKDKNVNFYINASYNHSNPITTSSSQSEYFSNNSTTSFLNENIESNNNTNAFYGTVGADFYLSKQSTLSTSINFLNTTIKNNTLTTSEIFDASYNPVELNDRTLLRNFDNEMVEFVADFTHNFKKEGEALATSITHTKDSDKFDDSINNTNLNFTDENSIEKNKLTNTSIKFKYTNPISEKSTYTFGFKGDYIKLPFKYTASTLMNNIDYSENVNAAYIEFENQSEKFYYGIGLRAEFIDMKVDYLSLSNLQKNNFDKVLPSVYLEYNLNDTKSLSLSFSKKMLTPFYDRLKPFEEKFSETSAFIGNPNLKPIYVDDFNLGFARFGNKITFLPSLFYQIFNDYWQDVTYETGEQINGVNKVITTPVNLGKLDYYGLNINTTFRANNMLSFTSNINIYNLDQTGTFTTVNNANETIILDYNDNSTNGSFSLFTQIKIPKAFNFQLNAKHTLKSVGSYSTRKAYTYASAAINKDLFNSDASLSLRVDDLFLSNETNRDRFNTNYFSKSLFKNKYRTILLSFTYRFNQSKKDRIIDFDKKDIKPTY